MLVIIIRIKTAEDRYALRAIEVSFQYLYNQLAVRSLPTSNVPAMIAIGSAAALKIAISPAMLNQAATPAIAKAVSSVNNPKSIVVFTEFFTPILLIIAVVNS